MNSFAENTAYFIRESRVHFLKTANNKKILLR